MDDRRDPAVTLPWMYEGTRRLLDTVDALSADELAGASRLPGWTRAHVVAHAALNAQALRRLVHWAATGEETPMYTSVGQREADIEVASRLPALQMRQFLRDESAGLAADLAALPAERWAATVRTREGREMPAAEIPWLRVREVWVHPVDLDAGVDCGGFPGRLAITLLWEAAARLSAVAGCPAMLLTPHDSEPVAVGGGDGPRVHVQGEVGDLLGWLIGRSDGSRLCPDALPALPAWL